MSAIQPLPSRGQTRGNPAAKSASPQPHPEARRSGGCFTFNRCRRRRQGAPWARTVRVARTGAAAPGSRARATAGWSEALRQPPAAAHAPGGPRRRHSSRSQREGGSGCGHLRKEGEEQQGAREGKAEREKPPRKKLIVTSRSRSAAVPRQPEPMPGSRGKAARRGHTCRRSTYPLNTNMSECRAHFPPVRKAHHVCFSIMILSMFRRQICLNCK
ncbi:uncharacterized protein [Melanerpes formicivorus]|uniref:uncharacterized protein isoform X1 n=2 Tax=Melanerpes formicivorus TaxID=211600 RepID=UPI00358E81F0